MRGANRNAVPHAVAILLSRHALRSALPHPACGTLHPGRAAAIGVDTLSLDNGPSTTFSVHVNWLNADNFGLENLNNLDKVPRSGATAIVGVIPWQDGSGGPARVLATY